MDRRTGSLFARLHWPHTQDAITTDPTEKKKSQQRKNPAPKKIRKKPTNMLKTYTLGTRLCDTLALVLDRSMWCDRMATVKPMKLLSRPTAYSRVSLTLTGVKFTSTGNKRLSRELTKSA